MRSLRAALVIGCAGLLTFGAVFVVLQAGSPDVAPDLVEVTLTPVAPPSDSIALVMTPGRIAVGVPSTGFLPLLLDLQPGDRLDVLASLPSPTDSRPVSVVVVSGATVLRPATATDALLLEVSGPDAIALAHLVLGGTHLAFTVWPAGGNPPLQQPLDEQTARALLGLPALAVPSVATSTPAPTLAPYPTVAPTATPRPTSYVVQAGESLYSVASRLDVNPGALWWANRALVDPTVPLLAGTTLRVPLSAGFLYQVQPGDTWDSVATTFGMPASDIWLRNALPASSTLVSGMLLLIPAAS
ncbi:MAG TPA: LysM peptidoglycan-binding domain-containing protein [Chloroflexota bacterium]|nr:LysM peptidoglycan-binding domain-containing protein [Chloroflexota bacterium]